MVTKQKILVLNFLFAMFFSFDAKSDQIMDGHVLVGKALSEIININTEELLRISQSTSPPIYIDVRTPSEIDEQGLSLIHI